MLFRWFRRSAAVSESENAALVALTKQVLHLGAVVEQLRDDLETHKVVFASFRGRVYAWKGHEIPSEPQEKPQELPLDDPKVTKAELRARLLKPGKPFKHN